jgi:oxygen-independent coproporphyrinogen-3 oxidase
MVAAAVSSLREAGIDQLNIDLMYGLPEQGPADVARSAGLASSFDPGRIALFGYAHVPWMKKHQRLIDESALPDTQARLAQARIAAKTLTDLGYRAIGLDHFADPSDDLAIAAQSRYLRRNFQGYTTDNADALIGLGASAVSRLPQGFAQNAADVAGYARAIEAGRAATVKGIALTADDRLRAAVIERLLCDLAVDLDALAPDAAHRFADEIDALAPFVSAGAVNIAGSRITITEQGRHFARLVASVFDAFLPANKARHSVAV